MTTYPHDGAHCWHIMPDDVYCCGCVHAAHKGRDPESDDSGTGGNRG